MHALVIMRHAKAERGDGKPDFDRALEPRGINEADVVGARLAAQGFSPDHVLCSAARRTRDTLAAILQHFPGDCRIDLSRALYDAEVADLRDALRRAEGNAVLLIGHNPAVHGLALALAARGPGASALADGFPTASAAVFGVGFALDTARFERVVKP